MNDETLRQLESELASLKPAPLPAALHNAIARELDDAPLTFADRILATFMGAGALAASIILAIVVLNVATEPARPVQNNSDLATRQQIMREYQFLLAQR